VNLRQLDGLQALARRIRLGVLVEAPESVETLHSPLDVWIKVDRGLGRTGISWQEPAQIRQVAESIFARPNLRLRGLLTHAGHTYAAGDPDNVRRIYAESVARINTARAQLAETGIRGLECSVGDTPGCSLSEDLGAVDEIRPGNFVFYDAQQLTLGACRAEDVAVVLACPIVACHPERSEVVVYGGAIHLSKDDLYLGGQRTFGLVGLPTTQGWSAPIPGAFVRSLSQEHGVLRLPPEARHDFQPGGLVCIYPAHSCLSVTLMRGYLSLSGERIEIF
jgi:D-serine deaminase-like pyridoxal phosphate-dependent protein